MLQSYCPLMSIYAECHSCISPEHSRRSSLSFICTQIRTLTSPDFTNRHVSRAWPKHLSHDICTTLHDTIWSTARSKLDSHANIGASLALHDWHLFRRSLAHVHVLFSFVLSAALHSFSCLNHFALTVNSSSADPSKYISVISRWIKTSSFLVSGSSTENPKQISELSRLFSSTNFLDNSLSMIFEVQA